MRSADFLMVFESRILHYLASLYSSRLKKGDNYSTLKKTIGISLVDFILKSELSLLRSQLE